MLQGLTQHLPLLSGDLETTISFNHSKKVEAIGEYGSSLPVRASLAAAPGLLHSAPQHPCRSLYVISMLPSVLAAIYKCAGHH